MREACGLFAYTSLTTLARGIKTYTTACLAAEEWHRVYEYFETTVRELEKPLDIKERTEEPASLHTYIEAAEQKCA